MLEKFLEVKGVQELTVKEQKSITGGEAEARKGKRKGPQAK